MIKRVLILLAVLGAIAMVLCVLLFHRLVNAGAITAVEHFAPPILGVPVTLERVELSPFTGRGVLRGLVVGNPEGFQTENLVSVRRIEVEVGLRSLFSDTIHIHRIEIEKTEFTYERSRRTSNLATILDHIRKSEQDSTTRKSTPAESRTDRRMIVDEFRLTESRVIVAGGGSRASIPMSDVVLRNIGSDTDGVTPEVLADILFRTMAGQMTTSIAAHLGQAALSGPDSVFQIGRTVTRGTEGILGGLKNILTGGRGGASNDREGP